MWKYQTEDRKKVKRSGKKNMKSSPFNEKFNGLAVRDKMIFSKKFICYYNINWRQFVFFSS